MFGPLGSVSRASLTRARSIGWVNILRARFVRATALRSRATRRPSQYIGVLFYIHACRRGKTRGGGYAKRARGVKDVEPPPSVQSLLFFSKT